MKTPSKLSLGVIGLPPRYGLEAPGSTPGASVVPNRDRGLTARIREGYTASVPSGVRPQEFIHHVSFRLNDEQFIAAEALRATFPGNSWAEAFRWIFDSPEGRELIRRRVAGEA